VQSPFPSRGYFQKYKLVLENRQVSQTQIPGLVPPGHLFDKLQTQQSGGATTTLIFSSFIKM